MILKILHVNAAKMVLLGEIHSLNCYISIKEKLKVDNLKRTTEYPQRK